MHTLLSVFGDWVAIAAILPASIALYSIAPRWHRMKRARP